MKRAVLLFCVVALAGGVAMLVWASQRPYADIQRNATRGLGSLLVVSSVAAGAAALLPRRPRRSIRRRLDDEDGRRWRSPS